MKLGAPLQTLIKPVPLGRAMPPLQSSSLPDTSVTVNIIFREEEKGISSTRLYSLPTFSSKPTFRAATTMGASDELPFGSHFSSFVSGSTTLLRVVLQHSN